MTEEQLKLHEKHAVALKAEGILTGSPKYINPIRKLKDNPKTPTPITKPKNP